MQEGEPPPPPPRPVLPPHVPPPILLLLFFPSDSLSGLGCPLPSFTASITSFLVAEHQFIM